MPNRLREFHRSPDPASAAGLLQRLDIQTVPIASGPRNSAAPYAGAGAVVDLGMLRLDRIWQDAGAVQIGGQTTLQALIEAPLLQGLAGGILPQAAQLAAHLGLRHLATVGGLLQDLNSPPEVRLALLALAADVVTQGATREVTPLCDYYPKRNDLLLEISFKQLPAGSSGALARVARTTLDLAIVAAVAVAGPGFARVALAGASPQPIVKAATGAPVNARALAQSVATDVDPSGDYRGSADYRRAMAGVLALRALNAAQGGA
jgi:CO/xanthine dehydrogenase FAD-binding subunit